MTPLSPRETEMVVLAIQCLKDVVAQIDVDKFAAIGGYKNSESAKSSFGQLVRSKLSNATKDNYCVAHSATSSTPKKRVRPVTEANTSPKKRAKKNGSEAPGPKPSKLNLTPKEALKSEYKMDTEDEMGGKVKQEREEAANELVFTSPYTSEENH
ncbi:MAG: hypothetical protein Q9216_002883 [Gyalolechia sp. 2 TL-2023]